MGFCINKNQLKVTNFDDEPVYTISPEFRLGLQRSYIEDRNLETPSITLPTDMNLIRELSVAYTDPNTDPSDKILDQTTCFTDELSVSLNQELSRKFGSLSSQKQDNLLANLDFSELSGIAYQQLIELSKTYPKIKAYINRSVKNKQKNNNSISYQSYEFSHLPNPDSQDGLHLHMHFYLQDSERKDLFLHVHYHESSQTNLQSNSSCDDEYYYYYQEAPFKSNTNNLKEKQSDKTPATMRTLKFVNSKKNNTFSIDEEAQQLKAPDLLNKKPENVRGLSTRMSLSSRVSVKKTKNSASKHVHLDKTNEEDLHLHVHVHHDGFDDENIIKL